MRAASAVALLILVSGCISFGGQFQSFQLFPEQKVSQVEDLEVSVEAAPKEVTEGKKTSIFFDVANKGNTTLEDVKIEATDLCDFRLEEGFKRSKEFGTLHPGDSDSYEMQIRAEERELKKQCEIRFRTSYSSESRLLSNLAVISEDEMTRINRQNEDPGIRIVQVETKTPVDIDLSIKKDQPITTGTDFLAQMKLTNEGRGFADPIKIDHLTLKYPEDIVDLSSAGCDNLRRAEENKLQNGRVLEFRNKEVPPITCKFQTKSQKTTYTAGSSETVTLAVDDAPHDKFVTLFGRDIELAWVKAREGGKEASINIEGTDNVKLGQGESATSHNLSITVDSLSCDASSLTGCSHPHGKDQATLTVETTEDVAAGSDIVSEVRSFRADVSYKYTLRDSVTVTIQPE